jgi:hypothetical protein
LDAGAEVSPPDDVHVRRPPWCLLRWLAMLRM